MKALMTVRTIVRGQEGDAAMRVVHDEIVILEGGNNVLLRFARGEHVPLWPLASHVATFLLSHRALLRDTLGPQNLEEEYDDDLMQLMWRAYEIQSDEDCPMITYRFRRILNDDEDVFGEEPGRIREGELQYRWVQGDEKPDVVMQLCCTPLEEDDTIATNAFGQAVMLMSCNTITLADDSVMAPEDHTQN